MKILFLIFSLISFCFAQTPTADIFTSYPVLTQGVVIGALIWYIRSSEAKSEAKQKDLEIKNEVKQKEINEAHKLNHDANAVKIQELETNAKELDGYIKNEFLKVIEKNNNLIEKFLEKLDKDENK